MWQRTMPSRSDKGRVLTPASAESIESESIQPKSAVILGPGRARSRHLACLTPLADDGYCQSLAALHEILNWEITIPNPFTRSISPSQSSCSLVSSCRFQSFLFAISEPPGLSPRPTHRIVWYILVHYY